MKKAGNCRRHPAERTPTCARTTWVIGKTHTRDARDINNTNDGAAASRADVINGVAF